MDCHEPFQYETVPSPAHLGLTRTLTLAPGNPAEPLVGTLAAMTVAHPEQPFEALSYVWGRRGDLTDTIICNGKTLHITTNLAVALRRLRFADRSRTLWADQVCINQKDLVERGQQVRHMETLYRVATKVLVWLGEDPDGHAGRAFALAKSLSDISLEKAAVENLAEESVSQLPEEQWTSFAVLFRQTWFRRKWVLQEIGTGSPAEVFWGDLSVDWSHIAAASFLIRDAGYNMRRKYDLWVWRAWYMDRLFVPETYTGRALSFPYELHRARGHLASDPRDHIFALLGHPAARRQAPQGFPVVEADYTKSVADVYHELAVCMLKQHDSLMMLNTVQHESLQSAMERHPGLPTWVTQWDHNEAHQHILGDTKCPYRSSRELQPKLTFSDSLRTLQIDGIIIDLIAFTTSVFKSSDATLGSSTFADLWRSLPENDDIGTLSTAHQYRPRTAADFDDGRTDNEEEPSLHAFLETLSAVKSLRGLEDTTKSRRLAGGASFLVQAYSDNHAISDDVREMGRTGDVNIWLERVVGGIKGRRFARSRGGYFALCPPAVEEGDVLCLLFGGQSLYCLRPAGSHGGDGYYFVGECYVHGLMDGEAINMLEYGRAKREALFIR